MQLKTYNYSMLGATVVAWLGFFLVISNFDPDQANVVVFVFLYFSLFLSILGTLSLLGFLLRKLLQRKKEQSYKVATESFRQAFIFATVVVVALILQATRLLNWWNILLLIIFATLLEFIILSFRKDLEIK
ncbi:hypothetical protein H6761_00315 [Candidatus Nomurabacteria bacterium]|nr:hypothetical protein [Candidatus Nomurabacteria bacterium]